MGYYTTYCLWIENKNELAPDIEYRVAKALARLDEFAMDEVLDQKKFFEGIETSNFPISYVIGNEDIKWYNWQDDMIKIAAEFPECIFILEGHGEESDDIWRAYFYGDKYYRTFAHLEFDEPSWL